MIGRPQPTEAAPYYFTYINQVSGDDAGQVIVRQLEESQEFFAAISEDASLFRDSLDTWSIRKVLNHSTVSAAWPSERSSSPSSTGRFSSILNFTICEGE